MGAAGVAQPGRKRPPTPLLVAVTYTMCESGAWCWAGEDRNMLGCCLEQLGRCCDSPQLHAGPSSATRYPALLDNFPLPGLHDPLLAA